MQRTFPFRPGRKCKQIILTLPIPIPFSNIRMFEWLGDWMFVQQFNWRATEIRGAKRTNQDEYEKANLNVNENKWKTRSRRKKGKREEEKKERCKEKEEEKEDEKILTKSLLAHLYTCHYFSRYFTAKLNTRYRFQVIPSPIQKERKKIITWWWSF